MEILKIGEENYFEVIMRAVAALREGKVVAVPTDTVYGLAVDATSDEAVKRLFQIKKREEGKPMPVLVDSMERAKQIAFIEEKKLEGELSEQWPGAFTAILYAREMVSLLARGRGGLTVGVRIPDHRFLRDLIRAFGKPITGTSANRSGEKPATRAEEIMNADIVIDGGICDGTPSTVVDFTVTPSKVLRE
jgi:L-threonylcarbamoyladenylate synthase